MVIAIITAAVAVTLCALVAIAHMFGWLPQRGALATPASIASPGRQVAGTADGVAQLPGETLVTPDATAAAPGPSATPAPSKPNYARPAPSTAPVPRDPAPEPSSRAPAPAPNPPARARAAPQRSVCVNCGTVTSTTAFPDSWEVRVRFEDGDTHTFRYRSPPEFRIGQRVRVENDRLVGDR
jgi:hypothetical protein